MKKSLIIIFSLTVTLFVAVEANANTEKNTKDVATEQTVSKDNDATKSVEEKAKVAAPAKGEVKEAATKSAKHPQKQKQNFSWTEILLIVLVVSLIGAFVWLWQLIRRLESVVMADRAQNVKLIDAKIKESEDLTDIKIRDAIKKYNTRVAAEREEVERQRRLAKLEAERLAQEQKQASVFRPKTLYGSYESSCKGFEHRWLKENRSSSSHVEITTTSETSADFRVLPNLDSSLMGIALDACDVVAGDQRNYFSYNIIESGRLTFNDKTQVWEVTKRAKIEFVK